MRLHIKSPLLHYISDLRLKLIYLTLEQLGGLVQVVMYRKMSDSKLIFNILERIWPIY